MNLLELMQFRAALQVANIAVPTAITRGLELIHLATQETSPSGGLLDLTDDEVTGRITELSIRGHEGPTAESRGMAGGVRQFEAQVLQEVREASLDVIEGLIADLRPKFEELAKPLVTAAQKYGFTLATTSDYVVDLADEKASKAWRDARTAFHALAPLARLRTQISDVFKVSPTREEVNRLFFAQGLYDTGFLSGRPMDNTILFAAAGNWSYDLAYSVSAKNHTGTDWLAMAAGGGLTLNTTAQVKEKLEHRAVVRIPTPAKEDTKPLPNTSMLLPRYDAA